MVRPSDLMMYTYIVYNPLFYSLTKCASSSLHYRNIILDQWGDFKSDASQVFVIRALIGFHVAVVEEYLIF